MFKTNYEVELYSSARSGRSKRIVLAPPPLIFIIFGVSVILQIPIGYIIHHFSFTGGMLLNQVGTLLLPVLVAIRFFRLTGSKVLPFKKIDIKAVFVAGFMMLSLAIVTDYLVFFTEAILPVGESIHEMYRKLMHVNSFGSYLHKFAILCILPSFCEEIFFRGFCQTGLMRYYGRWVGILIAAALFAIAHLNPWYIHLYFVLGVILSWLFATSGSLWIPIICHVVNNSWTFTTNALDKSLPMSKSLGFGDAMIMTIATVLFVLSIYAWKGLVSKPKTSK